MSDIKDQHLSLIYDISELSALVTNSKDITSFLHQVVQSVASHLSADVGSIYLLDDDQNELVLAATKGLNPQSVNSIRMKIGEGLVGATMASMEALCDGAACNNPLFKHFEEAGEDLYKSFLSVPIHRGIEKIGVLVVQHTQPDYFHTTDVMALRAIAAQLAGTIANAKLMIGLQKRTKDSLIHPDFESLRFVKGKTASAGYAFGPAIPLKSQDPMLTDVPIEDFHLSVDSYHRSIKQTIEQLATLQEQLTRKLPEGAALIFEAHYMILKDPHFDRQIVDYIQQGQAAPEAVRQVTQHFIAMFKQSPSAYIQEKSQDIEDLARRILHNLRKHKDERKSPLEGHVVIASQIYPSDVLKLASESVAAIVLVGGGGTSHVAIIARSLKIPLVITNNSALLGIPVGTPVLVDADVGNVYVNPSEQIRRQFEERNTLTSIANKAIYVKPDTHSTDGTRIELMANINLLSELESAIALKAEGVGLYRSEFPFIVRSVFPTEEEQRLVYRQLFEKMTGLPVYVRALDIGGDKVLPYLNLPTGANPELGLRSIRFLLRHRDVFDQQIRAILRAAAGAEHLGIMFPMISSLDEFLAARQVVEDAKTSLIKDQLDFYSEPMIGTMIEMPSVLPIIDELADAADFFSIGTNDFIQYMLAVDRTNENVAGFFQPFQPSILRGLASIVGTANKYHKPVCVCGETAHDSEFIPFLIGIGVRRLSVDPQFLPAVQQSIGTFSLSQAEEFAQALLSAKSLHQVDSVRQRWP